MDLYPPMTRARERRALFEKNEDAWVCERCGETCEEALAIKTTGRCTRSEPSGSKCVCLCGHCREARGVMYGEVVDS